MVLGVVAVAVGWPHWTQGSSHVDLLDDVVAAVQTMKLADAVEDSPDATKLT